MPDLRSVRVFVSSTFRDFAEERDALATHAWPALRALCEERAVTFTDVDLRWGITDEQAAEGRVLPICLAEIDASRPYFIGILGERYGWVPEEIPEHLVEAMPWLAEHKTKSVTELEIAHGVLNDPEMAGRAFFYFRDPAYAASVPGDRRADFVSEDAEAASKLAALKDRIRASGLPLEEGFSTPAELAERVVADLSAAIDEAYPQDEAPDPLSRDRLAHEAYALSRRGVWIGRESDLAALDTHAAGEGPPLVVTGASGGGKSALLANWAASYRASHPDAIVIEHYCGAGADAAEWAAMCRRIAGELAAATGLEFELPTGPSELKNSFKDALVRLATVCRVVLLVDGVNQLADEAGAPDLAWLPPEPPPTLRLVVATLPGRSLDEARRRGWAEIEVGPLSPEERTRLVSAYLASFAKTLPPKLAARIAASPQAANPLFVRVLLDELRVAADHERLASTIERYLAVTEVDDLYELVLERYERDYEREHPGLVKDVFSALWAARLGLSERELLGILGAEGAPLPRAVFSPLYLAARTSLISKSGLLGFAHDFMRQAVEYRYLSSGEEKEAAHAVLAGWFRGEADPTGARTWLGPLRPLIETAFHFGRAGAYDSLWAVVSDARFLVACANKLPVASTSLDPGRDPRVEVRYDGCRQLVAALDGGLRGSLRMESSAGRSLDSMAGALQKTQAVAACFPWLVAEHVARCLRLEEGHSDVAERLLEASTGDEGRAVRATPLWDPDRASAPERAVRLTGGRGACVDWSRGTVYVVSNLGQLTVIDMTDDWRSREVGTSLRGASDLAISPDGLAAVVAAPGGRIVLMDPESGSTIDAIESGDDDASSVHFLAENLVVASSLRGHVLSFDVSGATISARASRLIPVERAICQVLPSPDGTRLYCYNRRDRAILVLKADTLTTLKQIDLGPHRISALCASADGTLLWGACLDDLVRAWDARTGELLSTSLVIPTDLSEPLRWRDGDMGLPEPEPNVWACAAAENGEVLAVQTRASVELLEVATGDTRLPLAIQHPYPELISISPDGSRLITWQNGRRVLELWASDADGTARPRGAVLCLDFAPQGDRLLVGWADGEITWQDMVTGEHSTSQLPATMGADRLVVSPGGDAVYVSGFHVGTGCFDLNTGLRRWHVRDYETAVSPDGTSVAVLSLGWSEHQTVSILDSVSGVTRKRVNHSQPGELRPPATAFSSDGQQLAVCSGSHNCVYRTADGSMIARLTREDRGTFSSCWFSCNDRYLHAVSPDPAMHMGETGMVYTWDLHQHRLVGSWYCPTVEEVLAPLEEQRFIALHGRGPSSAMLVSLADASDAVFWAAETEVNCLAVTRRGDLVALGTALGVEVLRLSYADEHVQWNRRLHGLSLSSS